MSAKMVSRRTFLRAAAATGLVAGPAFAAGRPAEPRARRPNIVLILADDLGWADLGCYGNRFNETPNIDRLAAHGLRFTDFYAAAPVCSPTRASIMAGQHPARLGLTAHIPGHWRPFEKLVEPPNAQALPLDIVTIAEALRDTGYATAHFGKWHLGGAQQGPKAQGFDEAFEFVGHTIPPARLGAGVTQGKRACEHLADLAVAFMQAHHDRPFFIQLCPSAVHIPLDTTAALKAKYEAKAKAPGYACHPLYAGLLEELDAVVGKVMAELDRLKLDDDTLLVFASDNGGLEREMGGWPGTTNTPLRNEKGTLYEGGLRVPVLVRWPGVTTPGSTCGALGISTDLYPTFLEAAQAAPPRDQAMDGISLVPLLRDPAARLLRQTLYWHYPHYHHSRPSGAIRDGDLKAIEFFDTGEVELYNVKDDISEWKNLAAQMPDRARELRGRLARWRQEVAAQMPQTNPAYDAKRANEWWDRRTMQPTEAPGAYRAEGAATQP